ncbi:hypothetical protein SASPL_148214 [Salvia splendens]|uniref:Pectinesterase inhibitor domain-containing protein n=1 Tax=Salvia splendens TaxID=180675 RepID=A0A8X8Z429_SALSN|nr:uncharacterized protein LOC121780167 [Salvia splendens]KAG6390479.1 hypothetical protein SASPL_148214 [Salvia splendens]
MKTLLSIFFVIVIVVALLRPSLADKQTDDLINKVCYYAGDDSFCQGILHKNLPPPPVDLAGLTRLTLNLTLSFTKETLALVEKAEADEKRLGVRQRYYWCRIGYIKVLSNVQTAEYNARRSEFDSMVTTLGLCSEPIKQCQRNVAGLLPALKEKSRMMLVLIEMGSNAGTYL